MKELLVAVILVYEKIAPPPQKFDVVSIGSGATKLINTLMRFSILFFFVLFWFFFFCVTSYLPLQVAVYRQSLKVEESTVTAP